MKIIKYHHIFILIFNVITALTAQAVEFCATNNFILNDDQSLAGEYWIYAETSLVNGIVNSDIFIAAETVKLGGDFSNDLWAFGNNVSFTGKANDQVRLAGKIVQIGGTQQGLSVVGETVKCSATHCDGDMILFGNDVIFEGECSGNTHIAGNRVTINGKFGGDVRLIGSDIVISPNTHISGDLTYTSPKELHLQSEIAIDGELIRKSTIAISAQSKSNPIKLLLAQILWFIAAVLVGIPFLALFPSTIGESVLAVRRYSWICMLIGMTAFITIPIFATLIFFSVIGAPLSLILLTSFGILLYLAKYPLALLFGQFILRSRLPRNFKDISLIMLVGLAAIYIISLLPFIGGTFKLLVTLYGLGAILKGGITRRRAKCVLLDSREIT